jgi:hypothetical protein
MIFGLCGNNLESFADDSELRSAARHVHHGGHKQDDESIFRLQDF